MGYTTIFRLVINQVERDPPIISSNYRAPRTQRSVEYYASRTSAETKRDEIYSGLKNLIGFIEGVEVVIEEVRLNQ